MKLILTVAIGLISLTSFAEEITILRKETTQVTGSAWEHYTNAGPGNCKVHACVYEVKRDENNNYRVQFGLESDESCSGSIMQGDGYTFKNIELPLKDGYTQGWTSEDSPEYRYVSYNKNILKKKQKSFFCDQTDGCLFTRYAKNSSRIELSADLMTVKSVSSTETTPNSIAGSERLEFTCKF